MFRVVILTCAVCTALVVTVGCSSSSAESSPIASTTSTMGAAGSTFIAPLMSAWTKGYQQSLPNVRLNYRPIGSGAGIDEFKKGWLEIAASDAPLTDDELKGILPTVQVPATAGPVCIVYNLPHLDRPLRLSPRTLAEIYLGNIISWQDPAIERDNPGAKLPRAPVIVVHRSDGSGTTSIFTTYLSKISQDWTRTTGHGLSVTWPVGFGGDGSKGVLNLVGQTGGTIGYFELSYATESKASVAAVENQAGAFVAPSPASADAALDAFKDELAKDVRTPVVDPPVSAKAAYPITGISFLLVSKDNPSMSEQMAVRDFIAYAISNGQDAAEGLSYAKLPPSVQQKANALLAQLTVKGQPLK
ncbi:MAG: phosphate ABC transporter substrate-binding protein PstS [Bryobacteraceae bacterium]